MERYQLIREYPGSPDKGTVVYHPHRQKGYEDDYFKTRNTREIDNRIFYSEEYIKNFPKHWKKI